jgi:hypothetical protein
MGKMQRHPVLQGLFTPQLPLQVKFCGSVRSCRAETVPAQRAAVSMNARKILEKAFMMRSFTLAPAKIVPQENMHAARRRSLRADINKKCRSETEQEIIFESSSSTSGQALPALFAQKQISPLINTDDTDKKIFLR